MNIPIPPALIAPCGLDCRLCSAYRRKRNGCLGCRSNDGYKSKSCQQCPIRNCDKLAASGLKYCFQCTEFPCSLLTRLDKRYRSTYGVSTMENLERIRSFGIRRFIGEEKERWRCPGCCGLLSMHSQQCGNCGHERKLFSV
jgi:Protein of unknown function (DUF3795)